MLKKIGSLTILGLVLLIISGIFYFFSFSRFSQGNLIGIIFPQDSLIGIIGISGILFGFLFIVLDFKRIKKKDVINEIHSDLIGFGKIIVVIFIAAVIDILIFTKYIAYFGGLLGGFVCFTIILPLILIGLGIFLTLIRTPFGKSLTNIKVNIFFIILLIVLIILPVYIVWPAISPTYMSGQPIRQLHLSSDGSFLLSISGGAANLASENKSEFKQIYDYIIWNTSSGNPIWNRTTKNYDDIRISPDGKYVEDPLDQSIRSITSGEALTYCPGLPYDWSADGNFFVKAGSQSIYVMSTSNYSIIQTIPVNGSIHMIALSSDGSKVAVELSREQNKTLRLIDAQTMKSTVLYDFSNYSVYEIKFLSWSFDKNQLQMIEDDYTRNSSLKHYYQIIWNVSDDDNITVSTFEDLGGLRYNIVEAIFGKYITLAHPQTQQSQFQLYDLDGVKNVYSYEQYISKISLSSDGNIIACSYNGLIDIINTTTGKAIKILSPPQYEFKRAIPGFEIIILLCAILLFVIWKSIF